MITPRYNPSETLKITGLKPETLQTWVNRGMIELAEQNPGRGKRRFYSALDVVKLAIMRRTDDLNIALSVACDWADWAAEILLRDNEIDWEFYITHRPSNNSSNSVSVTTSGSRFSKYAGVHGDPRHMLVSDLVEPFEGVIGSRRVKKRLRDMIQSTGEESNSSDSRPIDPASREYLAQRGVHAEPAIIFPLGEIANGALAQLRAIESGGNDD